MGLQYRAKLTSVAGDTDAASIDIFDESFVSAYNEIYDGEDATAARIIFAPPRLPNTSSSALLGHTPTVVPVATITSAALVASRLYSTGQITLEAHEHVE